ncbi:MAG: hypothetical protein KBT12_03250 [Bacteroidales bacterium]|nr:hypothetical protein [Candidatus Physcousia equi]
MKKTYITPLTEVSELSIKASMLVNMSIEKGESGPNQPNVGEAKEDADWNIWND